MFFLKYPLHFLLDDKAFDQLNLAFEGFAVVIHKGYNQWLNSD